MRGERRYNLSTNWQESEYLPNIYQGVQVLLLPVEIKEDSVEDGGGGGAPGKQGQPLLQGFAGGNTEACQLPTP